ncbi:hypothetical protein SAMN05421538_109104 [Paracoccus isoporae]|uniref:Uncharacterized protein n=1 Tax=Paracoccus isoporae TaxID=591205 RepID=A0A1G7EWX2_9RHOB|nr:hypothetical protein [Paracoccus isoporae]SDE68147.1 hypothetical protein SAMN05421538_109104 [Paracoccus isoporae]
MNALPKRFFISAAIFALIGMVWGIVMSASADHSMSPAHGHLNLIGFVAMAVFGTYYALTPQAAETRLAQIHFAVSLIAVMVIVPGIALAIAQGQEVLAKLGSVLSLAAMAIFALTVFRHGVGTQHAQRG